MGARIARIVPLVLGIALVPLASAAVDLNGKWRFDTSFFSVVTTVTQTGSSVTIPLFFPLTGTIGATDPSGFTSYSVTYSDASVMAGMAGRITPSGNLLDGRLGALFVGTPSVDSVVGTRCTCDDGNTADGDGCDAVRQVEPCWTCTGDPSVCSPTADGGACDDRRDCTAGETCTAGVCVGGTPLSPCIDMSGIWTRHREIPALGVVEDFTSAATQRGGDVRMGGYVGVIDPVTGAFDLRSFSSHLFCFGQPLTGTVSAEGLTYEADGFIQEPQPLAPDHCDFLVLTETGSRCSNATIDAGEECDDGNLATGDGCDAQCRVEQCWACAGQPSYCTAAPGDPCDDGNACTASDTCASDGSCDGTGVVCEACLECDANLGCIALPLLPCKASTRPEKSLLRIKNVADDTKDNFTWKWNDGETTTLAELGDPPAGDGYAVCVYDESGPTTLLFRAHVPGGGQCGAKPCWKAPGGDGFRYGNQAATPEGVVVARLESGTPAKAKVTGKGVHLSDHLSGLPSLPLVAPLRVQLRGDNGLCLETRHDVSTILKNDVTTGVFKARGAP